MKRLFFFLLTIFLSLVPTQTSFIQTAHAATIAQTNDLFPLPIRKPFQGSFLGENQYYSVHFRGNGEAVVTTRILLTNVEKPIQSVTLQFSKNIHPTDIHIIQVFQEPACIQFQPIPLSSGSSGIISPAPNQSNCLEFQQPNYQYLSETATYKKVPFILKDTMLTLQLPTAITQNGAYFVYYRSFGYTKKDLFGAYNYSFETLKVNDKINAMQVGINTDSDYVLKGTNADVNFAPRALTAVIPPATSGTNTTIGPDFSQFYNQIGQGSILKMASNLAPMETYGVKGVYANAQYKLYGGEITTGVIILLLFLGILIAIPFVILKRRRSLSAPKDEKPAALKSMKSLSPVSLFVLALGMGFASSLLIFLYSLGIFFVISILNSSSYFSSVNVNIIILLCIFAFSFVLYAFLFFAPGIGMAVKKGLTWGMVTFGLTIFWAILFAIILVVVIILFNQSNQSPSPIPYVGSPVQIEPQFGPQPK